jgi:hypothetical protein
MFEYWSWWIGSLSLALLAMGFLLVLNRPLGVSGTWARVVMHNKDNALREEERPFRENPVMFKDALMAATIEEFGRQAVVDFLAQRKGKPVSRDKLEAVKVAARTHWSAHLTFLLMLVAGGLLAAMLTGRFEWRTDFGVLHTSLFGGGIGYWITLIIGGAMVGFGTQLAGGCSSGHGLCGCARFFPASLIATATFFITGIVTSMIIHYVATGALQ